MKPQQKLKPEWKEINFLDCLEKEASSNNLKISGKDFLQEGKYPIVDQGEDFIAGYTNDSSKVYDEKLPVVIFGDHTRILKFVNFPFALGADGVKILVPKKEIDAKYFYYSLRKLNIVSAGYSRHYKFLKEKKIPLPFSNGKPDLETQKQIVAVLEKAEALKQKQKRVLELYDEYLKSVFWEMFGSLTKNDKRWQICSLGNVCYFENGDRGKNYPSDHSKDSSGVPFVNAGHFENQRINKNNLNYIRKEQFEKLNSGKFRIGDFIFCLRGSIGKFAINKNIEEGAIASSLVIIRPEKIVPEYLEFVLGNSLCVNYVEQSNTSSSQPNLSSKNIKIFKIPLPPLPLQQKFTNIVEKVEKLKEKQKKSFENSKELFSALMQRAFRGELK